MKIDSTDKHLRREDTPAQPPTDAAGGRSVQSYIDETPKWADGTAASGAPLTGMQWRIWGLATAGKFFEGMVVFLTGVALPLIKQEFHLTAAEKGVVSSMILFGIDVLLIVGIITAVLLADKAGRIRLQITGFLGCAVGLALAVLSMNFTGMTQLALLFAGFMLFNFMANMGPNAQTYLLAGEVFPTHIRGRGAGFAASFAKIGAVTTAFLFPILLKDLGTQTLPPSWWSPPWPERCLPGFSALKPRGAVSRISARAEPAARKFRL